MSAEVYRIHSIQGTEPLVLFKEGAVRGLEALLAEPQQKIETVISDEEVIKYVPILIIFTKRKCTLGIPDSQLPMQEARVRSLVGELRSHKPWGTAKIFFKLKKKPTTKKTCQKPSVEP